MVDHGMFTEGVLQAQGVAQMPPHFLRARTLIGQVERKVRFHVELHKYNTLPHLTAMADIQFDSAL